MVREIHVQSVVFCEIKKMYVLRAVHEGMSYQEYFRGQKGASSLGTQLSAMSLL